MFFRSITAALFLLSPFSAQAASPYIWNSYFAGVSTGIHHNASDGLDLGYMLGIPPIPELFVINNTDAAGFMAGAQLGRNFQSGSFVYGFELDFSVLNAQETQTSEILFFDVLSVTDRESDWQASARLRGGILISPNLLVYATGGLVLSDVSITSRIDDIALCGCGGLPLTIFEGSASEIVPGLAFGAGFEVRISPTATAKLEYLHYEFADTTVIFTSPFFPDTLSFDFDNKSDVIRFGVNLALSADPF